MQSLAAEIAEAANISGPIRRKQPFAGIVLGTGLGSLADQIKRDSALPYASIPHFPQSTAIGHAGRLVCGLLCGLPVVAMDGRLPRLRAIPGHRYTYHLSPALDAGVRAQEVSDRLATPQGAINPQYASRPI